MRPFWTTGPVPPALLEGLALPRREARTALLATLREGRVARIGGPRGSGRTTLAFQVARALERPALLVHGASLTRPDEDAALAAVAESLDRRGASWSALAPAFQRAGRPVLILDGLGRTWAQQAGRRLEGALVVQIGGTGIAPDPIEATVARAFLQRRSQQVGAVWTGEALDQAVTLAAGHVDALQWLGHMTVAEARLAGANTIDLDAVLEGAASAAEHLPPHLVEAVARTRGAQWDLLRSIARRPDATPTEWGQMAEVPQNAVTVHLGRLVAGGLLVRTGRGQYVLSNPLVRLHLQGRFGTLAQVIPT